MKSAPLFVEPLEPRVAPAILVNGANLLGGAGNPTTGETSSGANTVTLIKVLSGEALVFYDAAHTQITSISVGKHTRLDITGDITGDIVTNLLPDGRLTDSDNNPANGQDGGVLLPYAIKGITTHPLGLTQTGSIGRIIAGGAVSNINVSGTLSGIYAGDGIFRDGPTASVSTGSVDYNPVLLGAQNTFTLNQSDAKSTSKANISNVAVFTADQLEIFAGGGSDNTGTTGGVGGTITNVTITHTTTGEGVKPVLYLHAGDGGTGTSGGAGGGITNFDDMDSLAYVKVQTGNGGAASGGTGGAGGSFENSTIVTSSPRYDLVMGYGGGGDTGGKGGSISTLNFTNKITGGQSLVATGDFNNDGHQDVLLINTLTGEGTLSLGTGNAAQPYTVALQSKTNADGTAGVTPFITAEGAAPSGVAAADLNGDGILDFVVSYASTDNLGVFLGHGDGTFTASSVALPVRPSHIAVGDFSGNTAPDIAVLSSSGSTAALNSTQNSSVLIVQNDGTGAFTPLANPVTVTGVGTDLAAAQIDGTGQTDLFVGLQSGGVDPLFATGTGFTVGTVINAFNTLGTPAPVTNLDVSTASGGTLLLAFSADINVNVKDATVVAPLADLISVAADGTANGTLTFTPNAGALKAHFVAGTDTVGVVDPSSVTLFTSDQGVYAPASSLSSNGVLSDFSAGAANGVYNIVAVGAATNRFFFTSGDPFGTTGLPAFQHFNLPYEERNISFIAGDGGAAGTHDGGTGGSIKALNYTQTLGDGVVEAGGDYNTNVITGKGGASTGGTGGTGGAIDKVSLSLMPGYENAGQDDTTFAFLHTGAGGSGATGGAGGGITRTTESTVFSDFENNQLNPQAVAVHLQAGDGGVGTVNAGGAGGNIKLDGPASMSGVTFYDIESTTPEAPALFVQGGNGGNGVTAGGAGGTLTNVGAQNAITNGYVIEYNELASANFVAGAGGSASQGDGGVGGSVTGLNASVQSYRDQTDPDLGFDGWIAASAGAGGSSSGGHGGAGGSVTKSTVATAEGDPNLHFGVIVNAGAGGAGTTGGGAGGGVKHLTVNTPAESDAYAAVIAAGNGGAATSGAGGTGGNVKGVTESKDVNSTITSILGGSGGNSSGGPGGAGGSIKNIDTVGFIGLPTSSTEYLGVFDTEFQSAPVAALFAGGNISQGLFVGRGGNGATAGSVHNVVAQQIAAIGAVVDENGLFGVAAAVTKVNADLIGYDTGTAPGFTSADGSGTSPATARPLDGFILAATVSDITGADPTRTAAYTFNG